MVECAVRCYYATLSEEAWEKGCVGGSVGWHRRSERGFDQLDVPIVLSSSSVLTCCAIPRCSFSVSLDVYWSAQVTAADRRSGDTPLRDCARSGVDGRACRFAGCCSGSGGSARPAADRYPLPVVILSSVLRCVLVLWRCLLCERLREQRATSTQLWDAEQGSVVTALAAGAL